VVIYDGIAYYQCEFLKIAISFGGSPSEEVDQNIHIIKNE
jgi:hypothetical protein